MSSIWEHEPAKTEHLSGVHFQTEKIVTGCLLCQYWVHLDDAHFWWMSWTVLFQRNEIDKVLPKSAFRNSIVRNIYNTSSKAHVNEPSVFGTRIHYHCLWRRMKEAWNQRVTARIKGMTAPLKIVQEADCIRSRSHVAVARNRTQNWCV